MARNRLIRQILPSFLLFTLLSLLLVSWLVARTFTGIELSQCERDLVSQASLVRALIENLPAERDDTSLQALCVSLGKKTGTRLTVILPDGRVVADSEKAPADMDNHANRPEVAQAMAGKEGHSVRFSYTTSEKMMYVAVPVETAAGKRIVRVSVPLQFIDASISLVYRRVAVGVLISMASAALLSWVLSRRIIRPLTALKAGAARFARGDFDVPLSIPDSEEAGDLAEALNEMARQCAYRIQAMEQQRNEQDAVFSSMMEGVLAVDSDLRIISMNEAASTLLRVDPLSSRGRPILEMVRNLGLRDFARDALSSETPVEGEVSVGQGDPVLLKVQGTMLRGGTGLAMGAVIVLNDITRLRRLEAVRQDFVANVSHELKTPITSIKGFVETLLDDPNPSPDDVRWFLQIIERQANRLDAIIEDLLSLSRLEQTKGAISLETTRARVLPIIEAAVELCHHQASVRNIRIQIACSDELAVHVNPHLLEQGLVNLINNAVKYSEDSQAVFVHAYTSADCLLIEVVDEGTGIHASELDRIFERFYRVDKARSRDQGGTGLGLSIVKHIAQAHGGSVSVSSTPGEGSIFTLHLPLRSSDGGLLNS